MSKVSKITINGVTKEIEDKEAQRKEDGKGLSANDYSNTEKQKVCEAYEAKHGHDNKTVLDLITAEKMAQWDAGGSGTDENAVHYTAESKTDEQKAQARANIGAGTSSFGGSYDDLTGKPDIPTKTSDLTNDSGYLTEHQSLSAYRTASAQDVIDDALITSLGNKIEKTMTATASGLSAGASPTVSYNSTTNTLSFGIPKGDKGDRGDRGSPTAVNQKTADSQDNITLYGSDIAVSDDAANTIEEALTDLGGRITRLEGTVQIHNAGAHNAIYRGKNLGTGVTSAQWAAIANGTFTDLYIGDYWVISGVNWRIAAFDYYLTTGDTACNTHHVVIVPDTNLYTHVMNDTDITTGGYVGSKMYKNGLAQALSTIETAFGASHILSHRQYLCNAVTNGYPSGGSWYDSKVELMTEQNAYGGKVMSPMGNGATVVANYTVDKSQYPLFAHDPHMISNRQYFWLRDVVSAAHFAHVSNHGYAYYNNASHANGVRPSFSIKS